MPFIVHGAVKRISDEMSTGSGFRKREVIVTVPNGDYPQTLKIEASGDNADVVSGFREKDKIAFEVAFRGREWEKEGRSGVVNSLRYLGHQVVDRLNPSQQPETLYVIVKQVGDVQQIKETFRKRELIVHRYDGEVTQTHVIEAINADCDKLNGLREGDEIELKVRFRGSESRNKTTGDMMCFLNVVYAGHKLADSPVPRAPESEDETYDNAPASAAPVAAAPKPTYNSATAVRQAATTNTPDPAEDDLPF